MVPSEIEKEILIEAPVDVVWHVVTEPEHIRRWFAERSEIDLRVGGAGHLAFRGGDAYEIQVEALDPPRRFAFRWVLRPGSVARSENSLLVEFTLLPEDGGTRVRVMESGFDQVDWSDEAKSRYAGDHAGGWERILGRLREYALTAGGAGR
jgi:uncharacterized protein YndB with AHSA1/START domain